jgi:hypothetical protein
MRYETDIKLGEKYREERSGIEGTAVAISFYEFGCERATIEHFNPSKGEIHEYTFDAPRLTSVETGQKAETSKSGGPARPVPRRSLR